MFITEDFLLENDTARHLYREHAGKLPIVDYHNHLNPRYIAEDYRFSSLTELWLGGDHYKWRALRANGVEEEYITGQADDWAKFKKWAETLPYTLRNPLYHWSHLELKRYFDIDILLNEESAGQIYRQCNALLQEKEYSVKGLLKKMKVETLCTTDDPVDSLEYHRQIAAEPFGVKVLPAWRPDKVMAVDDGTVYRAYIHKLAEVAGREIVQFGDLLDALENRQRYFAALGCCLSDHGLGTFPLASFDEAAMEILFTRLMSGQELTPEEREVFQTGMLYYLARLNHRMGWAQQFHIGAIRNNNRRLFRRLGPDVGGDSIADGPVAEALSAFLGRLDEEGCLPRTVLYNLNPKDSETLLSMAYNFNDGSETGKMQYGAAWWFLDQMDGITKQLNVLSNGGLLSRFIGMLTDSRSFLSFPRHEYFRRILCNMLGKEVESGILPAEALDFIGQMTEDIAYYNVKRYLKL